MCPILVRPPLELPLRSSGLGLGFTLDSAVIIFLISLSIAADVCAAFFSDSDFFKSASKVLILSLLNLSFVWSVITSLF